LFSSGTLYLVVVVGYPREAKDGGDLMRHPLALFVTMLALEMAQGAPARPLYEPPAAPALAPQLAGAWDGYFFSDSGRVQVYLHADGSLTYHCPTSTSPGSWRLSGNDVLIDINQYSQHRGKLVGDVIQGESFNRENTRGTFRLQRIRFRE
jgi:hypothetical protein